MFHCTIVQVHIILLHIYCTVLYSDILWNIILFAIGNDSIILMGIVGPEYEFIAVADGNNPLGTPPPKCLPERRKLVPHVCVGDNAFALSSYMMKPYPQTGLTENFQLQTFKVPTHI